MREVFLDGYQFWQQQQEDVAITMERPKQTRSNWFIATATASATTAAAATAHPIYNNIPSPKQGKLHGCQSRTKNVVMNEISREWNEWMNGKMKRPKLFNDVAKKNFKRAQVSFVLEIYRALFQAQRLELLSWYSINEFDWPKPTTKNWNRWSKLKPCILKMKSNSFIPRWWLLWWAANCRW